MHSLPFYSVPLHIPYHLILVHLYQLILHRQIFTLLLLSIFLHNLPVSTPIYSFTSLLFPAFTLLIPFYIPPLIHLDSPPAYSFTYSSIIHLFSQCLVYEFLIISTFILPQLLLYILSFIDTVNHSCLFPDIFFLISPYSCLILNVSPSTSTCLLIYIFLHAPYPCLS